LKAISVKPVSADDLDFWERKLEPELVNDSTVQETERLAIIRVRIGQGLDLVALPSDFDTQDAKPVLRGVEDDPLDQTGQDLGWRARPRCLRHQGMMEIKVLGRYRDQAGTACQAALATGERPRRREA
jgi:hypothetical protein